ncbi:hypothetical protein FQN60_004987 [Etheostoma spectabile]|uniref:Uncharacterized protein n=1 Tax=Etheostoma spectabile TaxID=54343 RepID=A0A5J5DLR4_9PERO|nr:hypothetical protein FQN60_004987 [Etheostoma spectabile]
MGCLAGEREESCASVECTAKGKEKKLSQATVGAGLVGGISSRKATRRCRYSTVSNRAMATRSHSRGVFKASPVGVPSSAIQLLLILCGLLLDAQGQVSTGDLQFHDSVIVVG